MVRATHLKFGIKWYQLPPIQWDYLGISSKTLIFPLGVMFTTLGFTIIMYVYIEDSHYGHSEKWTTLLQRNNVQSPMSLLLREFTVYSNRTEYN